MTGGQGRGEKVEFARNDTTGCQRQQNKCSAVAGWKIIVVVCIEIFSKKSCDCHEIH